MNRKERNLEIKIGKYQSFLNQIRKLARDLNCREISDRIKYFFNSEYGQSAEGITKPIEFKEKDCFVYYRCSAPLCFREKGIYCPIYRCLVEKELLEAKNLNREIITLKEKSEKHERLIQILFDKN